MSFVEGWILSENKYIIKEHLYSGSIIKFDSDIRIRYKKGNPDAE
jgi:hypothetical protein